MLSVTTNTLTLKAFTSPFTDNNLFRLNPLPLRFFSSKPLLKPVSASLIPPPNSQQRRQQQVYQPFRPPPSPLPPQFRNLDTASRLEVLANRLGLWFEYAPLIPTLYQEGFPPPSVEESTGISGVEQNRLVVAAQVRDSLVESNTDPEVLAFFDTGGAELLYEIRLLSASQRAAAARFLVENNCDAKGAQDLARAMKDFPRRRGEIAREKFNYVLPGDCLSFMYYRQSKEHKNPSEERTSFLELALQAAESDEAKKLIERELQGEIEEKDEKEVKIEDRVHVPVVRLKIGEVSEATSVVVLPVCRGEEKEKGISEAPFECRSEGEFGVVAAEKGWNRWVVLPGWEPVVGLGNGGVVVSFSDARVLPWRVNRWYKEEAILVVADRSRKAVEVDEGFYLVQLEDGELKVERGLALKERGVEESLGTVVLVVRPPKEEIDDQLSDDDWE
ncbi:hypothetical protein Pint_20419 [Pistacia integerrima]|uniref:Uncharacterized protein n=1 Tax=Pistacia integerrima TaxID=434235 RepID=A0ACC0XEZ4_9ROSI|nr:hypothetical protein Pint_20419 [Pistacia integerrima]